MTPTPSSTEDQHDSKRKNTQNKKETASVNETNRNGKRQCTRSATSTTTVSVKQEPDEEERKERGNKKNDDEEDVTTVSVKQEPNEEERKEHGKKKNDDDEDDDDDELPTIVELSEALCRIVDTETYSRKDGAATLRKMSIWLRTGDTDFLKSFHVLGACVKVLLFLTATMNDINCEGNDRSECISDAAMVIADAACGGVEVIAVANKDIVIKIVTSIVEYNGVNILINASEEYIGGEDESQLAALVYVWGALRNIFTGPAEELEIQTEAAIAVFETGIDVMSHLKSVDTPNSNYALGNIFITLSVLVKHDYITTDYCIQNNSIISKCLDVLKKNDGTWIDRGETVTKFAIILFYRFEKEGLLVNGDSDYEILLPFLAFALKQHATNQSVRNCALEMFDVSCATIVDKTILKGSGAMESLAALLQMSNAEIDNDCKTAVGLLIGKIAALE